MSSKLSHGTGTSVHARKRLGHRSQSPTAFKLVRTTLAALLLAGCSPVAPPDPGDVAGFLAFYSEVDQRLYKVASEAQWQASTDITEAHTGEKIGATAALAAFRGSPAVIKRSQAYLDSSEDLTDLQFRQLDKILLMAAESPGMIPEVVEQRVSIEARAAAKLAGFQYCLQQKGDNCAEPISSARISRILRDSIDIAERQRVWEVSKQVGPELKNDLAELRDLRNKVARELGYSSYFHLQVADYGMSVDELMELMDATLEDVRPLYEQLHLYARRTLAARYGQPVPEKIPAHWVGDRWGQSWPGLVDGARLDSLVEGKESEWFPRQAERFWSSLGFGDLPESFWEKSDLFRLPRESERRKDRQTLAWHIDRAQDVRLLMNITPSFFWFESSHHELGHVFYFLSYSNDDVPYLLRDGLNRSFHEAVSYLAVVAARQEPYLKEAGLLTEDGQLDPMDLLLSEALERFIVFLPWSAGVVTHFEYELYEKELPVEEFNQRWWELVDKYQGIVPPSERGEEYCDACTKPQLIDDPAQYYDFALGYLVTYQLHDHIARQILKADVRDCNYFGSTAAGDWLREILKLGATRDWRQVLQEKTGEGLSSRAAISHYEPLLEYLKKINTDEGQ